MTAFRLMPRPITGRHVLFGLFVFFGVMLIANGIFLYYALGTFNGFETENAYRRGITYNTRIAADAAQTARGWQAEARHDAGSGTLIVEMRDRREAGLAGLVLTGEIRRPVTDREDRTIIFQESTPARYAAPAQLAAGQWVLSLVVREPGKTGEPVYRFKKRFWVKREP